MKNKLLLLNAVLLVAIGAGVWRLREAWVAVRTREQAVLGRRMAPRSVDNATPDPRIEPVLATSYANIAEKMLFAKDRNPTVVVEVKPEVPKPMPKLPALYGVMNLLDGTTAIMSEKPDLKHVGVRPGDKIGEFTLVAVNRDEITLAWEGKEVTRKIDEMIDRAGPAQAPSVGVATRPKPVNGVVAPSQEPQKKGEPVPGVEVAKGIRACQPGDASPAGTVADGYKKLVTPTPFGDSCRWVPQ
ncbi:MAG TPA: hypothetical protein VNH83_12550 [Bryobacteraceae bacterium]|nr:hypothetical protein [Bryobacteraceae bacterium]